MTWRAAEQLIEATRHFKEVPPGSTPIHFNETGFFRRVYDTEQGVLDGLMEYMADMPAYNPRFFRVADPAEPKLPAEDIDYMIPFNQKMIYDFDGVLARLVDNSEHMEFRPGYGPEVYTGLVKVNGFLAGVIGNRQGFLGKDYPEYTKEYMAIGGKLYRQGLIKMNEFVTLCGRDRIPIIWFQDTSGIDVGDIAEKAELLGLGQSLIYSIEQTDVPQMLTVLRKGTAAAHYIMGGPTANNHNAFTLGTPHHRDLRHAWRDRGCGLLLPPPGQGEGCGPRPPAGHRQDERPGPAVPRPVPALVLRRAGVRGRGGFPFAKIRDYMVAFVSCAYQNPKSICPHHHQMLPRIIRG